MASNPSFTDRVTKAAELLSVEVKSLEVDLKKNGIENDSTGVSLLDADTTTIGDLEGILETGCGHGIPKLKLKASASILKGNSLTKTTTPHENTLPIVEPRTATQEAQTIAEVIKANRSIAEWSDLDLLERFSKERVYEVEQELHRRAKQQNFIVLLPSDKKYDPGKELIDIATSLELLKTSRKRVNPSMLPVDGKVLPIYKITELNPEDRIIDLCPLCGETLYKGYCEKCQQNFADIGDDERAYANLVANSGIFNVEGFSDRRAVVVSARKGLGDLKETWPSLVQEFDELKLTNSLPKLRSIMSRPSIADPYFQDGNRAFGPKKY